MILDDENSILSIEDITNQTLIDVCNGGKFYPRIFIEKATLELANRNVEVVIKQDPILEHKKEISYKNWFRNNLPFTIIILFAAIASGVVGFFVIISSVLISINPESRKERNKKWCYLSIALIAINAILILLTIEFMK